MEVPEAVVGAVRRFDTENLKYHVIYLTQK